MSSYQSRELLWCTEYLRPTRIKLTDYAILLNLNMYKPILVIDTVSDYLHTKYSMPYVTYITISES